MTGKIGRRLALEERGERVRLVEVRRKRRFQWLQNKKTPLLIPFFFPSATQNRPNRTPSGIKRSFDRPNEDLRMQQFVYES